MMNAVVSLVVLLWLCGAISGVVWGRWTGAGIIIIEMMGEKGTVNLLSLQKSIQESLRKPEAKEACLSFE